VLVIKTIVVIGASTIGCDRSCKKMLVFNGVDMAVKVKRRLTICIVMPLVFISGMYACRLLVRAYSIERNNQYAITWMAKVKEAQNIFKSKYGRYGALAELAHSGVMAPGWSETLRYDYTFEVILTEKGYEASAIPATVRTYNIIYKSYFLDESGVIRRD
jgi:hypothetical protein